MTGPGSGEVAIAVELIRMHQDRPILVAVQLVVTIHRGEAAVSPVIQSRGNATNGLPPIDRMASWLLIARGGTAAVFTVNSRKQMVVVCTIRVVLEKISLDDDPAVPKLAEQFSMKMVCALSQAVPADTAGGTLIVVQKFRICRDIVMAGIASSVVIITKAVH
jgi:hypothetical protein